MDGVSEEHVKTAIKKSRLIYNRGEVNEVRGRDGVKPSNHKLLASLLCKTENGMRSHA